MTLTVGSRARARNQPRDNRYRTGAGMILHGLGEGPGSVPWQSDVMPSQFWQDAGLSNEQRLCLAVLQDAIRCLHEIPGPARCSTTRARDEAEAWLLSDEDIWVLSFVGICEALGLDPGWIRAGILARQEAA